MVTVLYTVTLPQTHSSLATANRESPTREMPSSNFQPVILAGASCAVTSWAYAIYTLPKEMWISPWLTDEYESQESHPRHTLITSFGIPQKVLFQAMMFSISFLGMYPQYPNCMPRDTEEISSKPVILVNCGTDYRCMNWKKAGWFSWTEKCEV